MYKIEGFQCVMPKKGLENVTTLNAPLLDFEQVWFGACIIPGVSRTLQD